MRITSKGRYAVTAMLDIAIHQPDGMVSVKEIAQRQNISEPYLEICVSPIITLLCPLVKTPILKHNILTDSTKL